MQTMSLIDLKPISDNYIDLSFSQFISGDLSQIKIKIVDVNSELLKHVNYQIEISSPYFHTLYCSRRYREFYALHKALKLKYENIELPVFPSKYQIVNKIKSRIEGFQNLLNRIVEIAIQHEKIRINILKILFKFVSKNINKTPNKNDVSLNSSFVSQKIVAFNDEFFLKNENLENVPENCVIKRKFSFDFLEKEDMILKRKISAPLSQLKQINYEENEINFEKFFREFRKNSEEVFDNITNEDLSNFNMNVLVNFDKETNWKTFFSKFKNSNLLLFSSIGENYYDTLICCFNAKIEFSFQNKKNFFIEIYHKYDRRKIQIKPQINNLQNFKKLYKCLKTCGSKNEEFKMQDLQFKPIGKLSLNVCEANLPLPFNENSTLFVKIQHEPYTLKTKNVLATNNPKWNQRYVIPICNMFFEVKVDIYLVYNNGWISEDIKEECYASSSILISDFLCKMSSSERTFNLKLFFDEEQLKKMKFPENNENKEYNIIVKLQNFSNLNTFFAPQLENFIEGKYCQKHDFDKKELKINFHRMKRIRSIASMKIEDITSIFHFKYPKFSIICFIILMLIIFFFDFSQIINYILLFLIIIMTYHIPNLNLKINSIFSEYFFKETDLNKNYKIPQVETVFQIDNKKCSDINRFKGKIKGNKRSMIDKFQILKKNLSNLQFILALICNSIEKTINLLVWKDPQKTLFFYIFVIVFFLLFMSFPIRIFLLLSVLYKFVTGYFWYKSTYHSNIKLLRLFFKYLYEKIPENSNLFELSFNKFPETSSFQHFKKTWPNCLTTYFNIVIDNLTFNQYTNLNELIEGLSTCESRLKFNKDSIDFKLKYMLKQNNIKQKKFSIKLFTKINNYIYNIPSDYYRIRFPQKLFF